MNFYEVGIVEVAGMEAEELVHMRCMQLLVACNAELVLGAGTQWLGRRLLTWRSVAVYRRGLDVGTPFAM